VKKLMSSISTNAGRKQIVTRRRNASRSSTPAQRRQGGHYLRGAWLQFEKQAALPSPQMICLAELSILQLVNAFFQYTGAWKRLYAEDFHRGRKREDRQFSEQKLSAPRASRSKDLGRDY